MGGGVYKLIKHNQLSSEGRQRSMCNPNDPSGFQLLDLQVDPVCEIFLFMEFELALKPFQSGLFSQGPLFASHPSVSTIRRRD